MGKFCFVMVISHVLVVWFFVCFFFAYYLTLYVLFELIEHLSKEGRVERVDGNR